MAEPSGALNASARAPQRRARAVVASCAALTLVASLFTANPAAAAVNRGGFPGQPEDPKVTGTVAAELPGVEKTKHSKSDVVDDQQSVTFTVPLTEGGVSTPESESAGISVLPASKNAGRAVSRPLESDSDSPNPEGTPGTAAPTPEPTETAEPEQPETPSPTAAPSASPEPTIAPPRAAPEEVEIEVEVWDQTRRQKAGGVEYAVELTPSSSAESSYQVIVSKEAIADVFGADFDSRLRWVMVPADNASAKKIAAAKEIESQYTDAGTTFAVSASEPMVLAAVASTSSTEGSGTYAASPLKPASSWDVSAQTGAFAWSYPIPAPPVPAGASPSLSLSYNSQLVDGATSSTNNQPSAIGEGWTLTGGGFIERRYVTCSTEQAPGSPVAGSEDLCWATDNATISFGGRSGTIVKDASTGAWRLEDDDNSRIEKLVGAGQGCGANGTYNTECWRLTTTDGTQYYFGLNRLPGWAAGAAETKSAWTVPVFGNDVGDPCHASTFAASSCLQGWRWNLDYVVDVHGNAQALYYAAETNKYRVNDSTVTSYVRGGQLLRIDYGLTKSTVYATNSATSRIVFGYDSKGRCNPANAASCSTVALGGDAATPGTPSVYPDVPFDLNCTTGNCTWMTGPSFWTTARLATITTQSFTGGSYKSADVFTLAHSFPDPGDGESASLWLEKITRTATAGKTQIVESPTTFQRVAMQNRVWVVDGLAPLDKFRVSSVLLPTGGRISVNYSAQECTPSSAAAILASPWANDKRCFPVWWTPDLEIPTQARQDLFHKYVVVSMQEDPYTGGAGAPVIQTSYHYTGKPAWRYDDDPLIPATKRGWSEYAGYDKIEVRVGDPTMPAQQETTQYVFYRGLNGDRAGASGGAKNVAVTGSAIADDRWFAGQVHSTRVLNGAGGATVSETVVTPWASAPTAKNGTVEARVLGVARTDVTTPVSTGGSRTASTVNTMTARGFVSSVQTSAGAGERVTCSVTDYAADNASAWIIGLPSTTTEYSVPCGQVDTAAMSTVLSHKRLAYDDEAVGAAAARGLVSAAWEASGFTGDTLSTAQWVASGSFDYDAAGRITSSTDAANNKVSTAYTPAAGAAAGAGPLTSTAITNAIGWTTTTTADPHRGLPTTVVDDNSKTTTIEYDALGRLTKVWRTDRPKANFPNEPSVSYAYTTSTTSPSIVKATTLTAKSTVSSFEFIDGLGRVVQTQAQAPGGGSVVTDTAYDRAGRAVATNDKYWAPTVTPGAALFVPGTTNQIAARSETIYDGVGRPVSSVLRAFGSEIRRTTTVYRGSDRVDSVPPAGGVPTSTFSDAFGRNIKVQQWHGTIDGAGVTSTSLRYDYNARDQLTRMRDDAENTWTWTYDLRGRQTSANDPDSGVTTSTYDDLGNLATREDARGKILAYTYDALNRKTTERSGSASGAILASWTYDSLAKGQLTSSSSFVDGQEYKTAATGYDNAYRPTGSTVSIPAGAPAFGGTTYSTSSYYNQDGTVAATVLPAAGGLPSEDLYPSYDTLGNQNSLVGAAMYVSQVSYLATGQVGQIVRPGTVWSALTFGYQAGTRELASLEETTRRNSTQFTREALREYTRNAAGLITAIKTSSDTHATDTQCFEYDPLQALTAAWTPANADCVGGPASALGGPAAYSSTYQVDRVTGNRIGTTTKTGASGTPVSTTYTYPLAGAERPHAVASIKTVTGGTTTYASYQHDAAGAMSQRGSQSLTYDDSGRLSTVTTGTSTEKSIYSADGQLLIRYGGTDGASLFLGDTILRKVGTTTTGVRTYRVAGIDVAERVSGVGGGLWWLSPDPVGTVTLQVNAGSGAVTRRWMDPFGAPRATSPAWSSPHGYLNAPRSSTGLTQLGARAYDPALGRFVSVDPILDPKEPRHANAYAYSMNSPVSYSDASGLRPLLTHPDTGKVVTTPSANRPTTSVRGERSNSTSSSTRTPGGGFRISPPDAPGNTPASVGFPSPPLSPSDPGWGDEIRELDRNCGSPNATKPCEIDRALAPVWFTVDLAMMVLPLGKIFSGLKIRRPSANAAASPPGVIRVDDLKLPGVPNGVRGTPTTSGKGMQYEIPRGTPELDPRVASIRVMDPVTTGKYHYPNGYVTYMNSGGQAVHPLTGRTLQPSDPLWHIKLP